MIVLDTNALLWLSGGSDNLGLKARARIEAAIDHGAAAFSAISVWEAATLVAKGRYALGQPVEAWRADLLGVGLKEAALDGRIAGLAVSIEGLGADPADRMIAATAIRLGAAIVSSDKSLLAWARNSPGEKPIDARR